MSVKASGMLSPSEQKSSSTASGRSSAQLNATCSTHSQTRNNKKKKIQILLVINELKNTAAGKVCFVITTLKIIGYSAGFTDTFKLTSCRYTQTLFTFSTCTCISLYFRGKYCTFYDDNLIKYCTTVQYRSLSQISHV